jgi:hypothetical protein
MSWQLRGDVPDSCANGALNTFGILADARTHLKQLIRDRNCSAS